MHGRHSQFPSPFAAFRRARLLLLALALLGLWLTPEPANAGDDMAGKRRQQGILTGMPFMANIAPRTFVDGLGRTVFLAQPPTRIVSLAPSITEILYAIGAADQLVGVTDFCDYPAEARTKPRVGYSHANLESIVALRPDLVLAPKEFLRADLLSKLEQLKIATFILEAKTVEDVPSHLQLLGRMLGRSAAANQVALELRRQLKSTTGRIQGLPRPRVLYVLNSVPLITVGPGSFIHHLIELAGGENVASAARTPYPRVNFEEVLQRDPEVIVFPVGSVEGIPPDEQQMWQRWPMISAVRQQRFAEISSDLLNRPGPRISQGLEALARIIHPEAFSDRVR